MNDSNISLEFSNKYDSKHSLEYYKKHKDSIGRRLSNRREQSMAEKALAIAGNPATVLDLPCGAGRFWPLLCEKPDRTIYASDYSHSMITTAKQLHDPFFTRRIQSFQASAFSISLKADSVDSIFCMRLLHHIVKKDHRLALLKEFHRVTKDTVCISLWVDGNYKAWKRERLELKRDRKGYKNRFVANRREIESEFREVGYNILGFIDFAKYYSMWRIYVLRKNITRANET